jgi:hypothetical protein
VAAAACSFPGLGALVEAEDLMGFALRNGVDDVVAMSGAASDVSAPERLLAR